MGRASRAKWQRRARRYQRGIVRMLVRKSARRLGDLFGRHPKFQRALAALPPRAAKV